MTIEEAIRHHAAQHKLSMTLITTSNGKYQCSLQNGPRTFRVEIDADPANAMLRALGLMPGSAGQMLPAEVAEDEGVFG